jgi:hypothetical protein
MSQSQIETVLLLIESAIKANNMEYADGLVQATYALGCMTHGEYRAFQAQITGVTV